MNLNLAPRVTSVFVTALLVAGVLAATSGPSSADSEEPADDRSISGVVTDAGGTPLAGVRVSPMSCNQYNCGTYGGVVTDASGVYTLPVMLDEVVVGFAADNYAGEYYDNVIDHRQARTFRLAPGENVNGINAALERPQISYEFNPPYVITSSGTGINKLRAIGTGTWSTGNPFIPASALSFTYQWHRSDDFRPQFPHRLIPGATASTYRTSEADLKQLIGVDVTASHPLLKSVTREVREFGPFMRDSAIQVLSKRSPRKRTVQIKVRVSAAGLPYASGRVSALCTNKRRAAVSSRPVQLKRGKATLTVKVKGFGKRPKRAYCRVEFDRTADTRGLVHPNPLRNESISVKLKQK